MREYPIKFHNLISICKNFGVLYHKAFYTMATMSMSSKINKIQTLKNRFDTLIQEFIQSSQNILGYHYDYLLDGTDHALYNIASSTIVLTHEKDILIYDIFADIIYYIFENQLYINNLPYVKNTTNNLSFSGNLQCDSLLLIYSRMGILNNSTINNAKLRQWVINIHV